MIHITDSPPRAPPIQYSAPLGTRWAKEKAAAGGTTAFDLPSDPKAIGPWILGECIGKGASGRVKIARHRRTGQLAAVKILPITPLVNSRSSLAIGKAKSEKQRLGIDREIAMMKLMNHPNITSIYDVFEGEKELFLVLEYVQGGELFDFLVNRGRLPPNEALEYFKQIIYGLNYAHTFSIIHRDLKPENILIASLKPPLIKIADWGMAAFAPPSLQLETSCGSPHYASPEIVNGEKYQGNATDIWSCGVILFALLTGRLPFDDKNVRNLLAKVKAGKYDMPNWIDPLAKNLIARMLVVDAKKRITIPEILSHPWLTTGYSACDTPDSGVVILTPPLPPSPSELARPIASPNDVDQELLASLRIIWGKHADAHGDNIIRDLCSPPGHGTHAKVFYFLLERYREETMRKRLADGPGDYPDTSQSTLEGKQRTPRIYRPRAQTSPTHQRPRSALLTMSQPPRTTIAFQEIAFQETTCNASQSPPSLVGPRPPPVCSSRSRAEAWRDQFQQGHSPNAMQSPTSPPSRPFSALATGGSDPRPHPPKRGRVCVGQNSSDNLDAHIPRDKSSHNHRSKSQGPVSNPETRGRVLVQDTSIPALSTPRTTGQVLQQTVDKISKSANERTTRHVSSTSSPRPGKRSFSPVITRKPLSQSSPQRENRRGRIASRSIVRKSTGKENQGVLDEEWSYISSDPDQSFLGLGAGTGRDVGRDIGNFPRIVTSPPRGRKEKKNRPPVLGLSQRNTPLDDLGSPVRVSSPAQTTSVPGGPGRLITTPVAGELKGWFTNLFNWKLNGQGIFYSIHNVSRTRSDIGQILESFGVSVDGTGSTISDGEQGDGLRCRLDFVTTDSLTGNTWKPTRFRVEFSPGTSDPLLSPKESVFPSTWVTAASISTPRDRATSFIGKAAASSMPLSSLAPPNSAQLPPGYECVVTMVHERGSTTTFKAIWKRLKELLGEVPPTHSCFSPGIPTTPPPDNSHRR